MYSRQHRYSIGVDAALDTMAFESHEDFCRAHDANVGIYNGLQLPSGLAGSGALNSVRNRRHGLPDNRPSARHWRQ